ncbi:hypothetical protein E2562_025893, partial [Oryza meyeriana var. granulata]
MLWSREEEDGSAQRQLVMACLGRHLLGSVDPSARAQMPDGLEEGGDRRKERACRGGLSIQSQYKANLIYK